jgi:hypothetical protein
LVWIFDLGHVASRIDAVPDPNHYPAATEAKLAGFDLSLVEASLRLTHEERATQHDQALLLVLEFDRIRASRRENTKPSPPKTG